MPQSKRNHQVADSVPSYYQSTSQSYSHSPNSVITPNNNPPSIILPENSANVQKRRRVTRACDECRKKKVKCDGQQPCIHCTVYSYECTYDQPSNRKKPPLDSNVIETKLKVNESIINLLLPNLKMENFNYKKFNLMFNELSSNNNINLADLVNSYNNDNSTPTPKEDLHSYFTPKKSPTEDEIGKEIKIILPQKDIALKLVFQTWSSACVLFRFYHRPTFIRDLDNLYETDPSQYTNHQQRLLPLIYSVMACGSLFSKRNENNVNTKNQLDDEGYRYFIAARKLIDITDVRDIYSIQTIVMLLIFLQCSARLSTCYSYIGLALRSALKEGLHRKLSHSNFNPIELETRKRLFYTIYKMDIYVNAMLGLPRSISEDDFDQELPMELDDENITEHGYLIQNQKKLSSAEIANHHTKLFMILSHVVKNLYPIKVSTNEILKDSTYIHNKVTELEIELKNWLDNLPNELKPGLNPSLQYLTANNYLHLGFLHIQIVLYRPFIHYISPMYHASPTKNENLDPRSIQRAKNCINVARTVVRLAKTMIDNNILSGAYWFSIYTIFFSVACLVFYVHSIPHEGADFLNSEIIGIKEDAEIGKKVLTLLKDTSKAALRTFNILNALFEQLNRRTAKLHPSSSYPIPNVPPTMPNNNTNSNNNDVKDVGNGANAINGSNGSTSSNATNGLSSMNVGKAEIPIIPDPTWDESTNNHHPHGDYVPGMIDKLDMQIFGRFLPPYMIEKSSQQQQQQQQAQAQAQAQQQAQQQQQGQPQPLGQMPELDGMGNQFELPFGLSTTNKISDDVMDDIPRYLDSLLGMSSFPVDGGFPDNNLNSLGGEFNADNIDEFKFGDDMNL